MLTPPLSTVSLCLQFRLLANYRPHIMSRIQIDQLLLFSVNRPCMGFFLGGGGHFCFSTATSMLPRSSDFSLPRSSSYTTKRWQRCVLVKCRVLVSQVDVRTFVIPTEILQIKDLNTRPHRRFTCHALVIVFCHFCISMPLMFICCLCSILMICFASIHCHCCSSATNKSFYKTTPLAFSWRRKKQQQQRTDDDKTSAPAAEE